MRTVYAEDRGDRYVFTVEDGNVTDVFEVAKVPEAARARAYVTIDDEHVLHLGADYPDGP